MHRLAYRPRVAYRISNSLPQANRFNSTDANGKAPAPGPADQPSEQPLPKPRIASTWGDVVIPSRQELLRGRSRKPVVVKPDLSYLTKGSTTSLASRLAAQAEADKPKQEVNLKQAVRPTLEVKPQEESTRSNEEIISTGEAAARPRQQIKKFSASIPLTPEEMEARQHRIDEATSKRRAERLAREEAWSQGSQTLASGGRPGFQSSRDRRPRRSEGGSGQRARVGLTRGGIARVSPTTTRKVAQGDEEGDQSEDITLEILEEGGDDKEPAQFKTADVPFANLDDVFAPAPTIRLAQQTSPLSDEYAQWIRETYGGDYSRFAPQSGDDFTVSHRKLGPLRHADLVLAKRRDIPIRARHEALAIVASSIGDAGTKAARRV